jgi:hypothetical protein
MEFGILFTSHPNHATEPYPHRAVHAWVTAEARRVSADGILRHLTHGLTSLLLHYPPHYGHEKAKRSLRLFAERVMPQSARPER